MERFKHPRRVRRGALVLVTAGLAITLATGCQTSQLGRYSGAGRAKMLDDVSLDYNKFIRWQEWERASDFVRPGEQSAFKEKLQEVEDTLRITEFEIQDMRVDPKGQSATVKVLYRYYRLPSITERKMFIRQHWTWFEQGNRWVIDEPLAFLTLGATKPSSGSAVAAEGK
jgi:hypothetical protein